MTDTVDEKLRRKKPWYWLTDTNYANRLVLNRDMVESEVFRSLSGNAVKLYLLLCLRLTVENRAGRNEKPEYRAKNNGELILSYKSAKRLIGFSSRTVSRVIDELVNKGFIEIAVIGEGKHRRSHKLAMIDLWKYIDQPDYEPGQGKALLPSNGGFKTKRRTPKRSL